MAYEVEWLVKDNTNPDKVYAEVSDFFQESTASDELIQQHIDIETDRVTSKDNILAEDGKSFVHTKTFDNVENYNVWSAQKAKLPAIDEHLTYTKV